MKRFLIPAVLLCALMGITVVAADKKPETPATKPATQPAHPINKYCAVDRDNPVDESVGTVTYEGKVIGFCCEDCIPKFKKNPKAYMKDLK
jgi:YHS domain-containing protein